MSIFRDTTDCVVHGHEGWLVPAEPHIHETDALDLYFFWGHNMEADGLAKADGLTAKVFAPNVEPKPLELTETKENCHVFHLTDAARGLNHYVAEKVAFYCRDAEGKYIEGTLKDVPTAVSCTRYLQYAHTALEVGHELENADYECVPSIPLYIKPKSWEQIWVGEKFPFTLYYDGKPLTLCDYEIAYSAKECSEVEHFNYMTDESGDGEIRFKKPGNYLFIVRCNSPEAEDGVYQNTKLTYTFWIRVKR